MVEGNVVGLNWMDFEGKRVRVTICKTGSALGCDDLGMR
jgi:hypothetical protein